MKNEKQKLTRIGTFHLGANYDSDELSSNPSFSISSGKEITSEMREEARQFILSPFFLLAFSPDPKSASTLMLSSWAHLSCLLSVKKKKDDEEILILKWKDSKNADGTLQIIRMENPEQFLDVLMRNMKANGVKVARSILKEYFSESEVNGQDIKRLDISAFKSQIDQLESKLNSGEISMDLLNSLTECYQKVIEYYTALEDEPSYMGYLERNKELFKREDVHELLSSQPSSSNKNHSKPSADSKGDSQEFPKEPKDKEPELEEEEHKGLISNLEENVSVNESLDNEQEQQEEESKEEENQGTKGENE